MTEEASIKFILRKIETARNRGYDGYQRTLASIVYRFFDKKTGSGISVNEQLAEELHKPFMPKKQYHIYFFSLL